MISHIHTPTPNLQQSLDFYQKLGFQVHTVGEQTFVTDGKALIEINEDRFARSGIKIYGEDWDSFVVEESATHSYIEVDDGYIVSAPSGIWVYLTATICPIDYKPEESFSLLGNYMGVSLESLNMDASIAFWERLGFSKTMGGAEQGWIALTSASGMGVSIMKARMCPHLFFNPSLTYFNSGKNLEVIANIRKAGIPITEEITQFNKEGIVDNVIIRDPGGYGFFIFND